MAIVLCLMITILSCLTFFMATDGFYGTNAPSLWAALHPVTLAQSDDVYLCNFMNGEGSDDALFPALLVLLAPLVPLRLFLRNSSPSWYEFGGFLVLSLPFLLAMFSGLATCADIALTIYVGGNLALALCLGGWFGTLVLYLQKTR